MSTLSGSTSNLDEKLMSTSNLNSLNDLLNGAKTANGTKNHSLISDKIYSIDHMIKSLNNKINYKLNNAGNQLHNCPTSLNDIYSGYNMQYLTQNFSNSKGSSSNTDNPCTSENQSMLSSLLEGCITDNNSTSNQTDQNSKLDANNKLLFFNSNLLGNCKSNDLNTQTSNTFNSTNTNLNLIHSLPYSSLVDSVNLETNSTNPLTNLTNFFKPLNAYNNLSNFTQFNHLNNLKASTNGLLAHHTSDLLSSYWS